MCYTLRDPVSAGTFPTAVEKKPRGKARRMEIKSRCFDACLVIDGSLSYKFNDGTRAIVSIHDEDVLRTVHIYSSNIWSRLYSRYPGNDDPYVDPGSSMGIISEWSVQVYWDWYYKKK